MAASSSSSTNFFVHNQNKENSSSAACALAADSDVVEFVEFPSATATTPRVAENLENSNRYVENTQNYEYNNIDDDRAIRASSSRLDNEDPVRTAEANSTATSFVASNKNENNSSSGGSGVSCSLISKRQDAGIEGYMQHQEQPHHSIPCSKEVNNNNNNYLPSRKDCKELAASAAYLVNDSELGCAKDEAISFSSHGEQVQLQQLPRSGVPPPTTTATVAASLNLDNQGAQQQRQQSSINLTLDQQQDARATAAAVLTATRPTPYRTSYDEAAMNSGQTTQSATGNRITFTSQPLPNGTISIGGGGTHHGGVGTGTTTIISTSQLPNTTTIKTITSSAAAVAGAHTLPQQVQVQHHSVLQTASTGPNVHHSQQQQQAQQSQAQHNAATQSVGATQTQTLVIKSNHHAVSLPAGLVSSAPGIVTMTKTLNQSNQPILNSMIPASVVVGMRSPAPQQPQKTGVPANTLGRVVIGGPHIGVAARPQNPAITLSTLTPGQAPALILKTENGFQLLRVGTASSTGQVTAQTIGGGGAVGTNSSNPTQIRLQTVPAASIAASTAGTTIVNHSVASTNSSQVYTTQANITSIGHQQQQQQQQQLQIQQQTQHLNTQPQITQIQTIPAQPLQAAANQTHPIGGGGGLSSTTTVVNSSSSSAPVTNTTPTAGTAAATSTTTVTTQNTATQGNTKEKCRKFLANLIDLSTREPKPVEKNVRNLIQELVNANVEPEEFCDRLERLLNASPQPCLIGFLKKSLPLLRHALFTKELTIEGIKPPPQHVVGISGLQQLPKIQAQIRPISQHQTMTIGQTQVRMVTPPTPVHRPIHRAIANQQTLRNPTLNNGQRFVTTTIRGPVIQPLLPGHTMTTIRPAAPIQTAGPRPNTVQIRATRPKGGITQVKVGQTHSKTMPAAMATSLGASQPPSLAAISSNSNSVSPSAFSSSSILSTINSVASAGSSPASSLSTGANIVLPTPSLPTVQLPIVVSSSTPSGDKSSVASESKVDLTKVGDKNGSATTASAMSKPSAKSTVTSSSSSGKASSKKRKDQMEKDKEDKTFVSSSSTTATASASFFQHPSISPSSAVYGDDDINDVAAMGGVNLAEESQRIMGCTENIGTQIRSCKDEVFLHLPALQARIRAKMIEHRLEEPAQDVAVLLSHACQEHLKNIVEKLAVIAEHRNDVIKLDPRYEVSKDVRGQIKFLEELDKAEQKRHEEIEREMLIRAAKSRSKIEDPEQAKMKARAKEMQRAEMEELRQRDANMTALQAIGPRKKIKLDGDTAGTGVSTTGSSLLASGGTATAPLRPRIKRINLRDMLFYMEQERETRRSETLYASYLK